MFRDIPYMNKKKYNIYVHILWFLFVKSNNITTKITNIHIFEIGKVYTF